MPALQHVFDATRENFQQLVLDNSRRGPVLVNYWAPNAGPCLRLWQALETLTQEYQGRFLLVNVNTETRQSLARSNGINSVPTVKIYRNGVVVESIYGAESETALRKIIDQHVPPARDTVLAQAIKSYQSGDADGALQILAQACIREPDNLKLHATAIKLLLREQRYDDIERYVCVLGEHLQSAPEINQLRIHAKLLQLAQQAPPAEQLDERLEHEPADIEARVLRAAVAMVQDDYAMALRYCLEALKQDPKFDGELPRKAMLAIFTLLGEQHELTREYQQALRDQLLQ